MNLFGPRKPERIDVPDLQMTIDTEGKRLTVHASGRDYVFLDIVPERLLRMYRETASLTPFRFEPLTYDDTVVEFAPAECIAITHNVVLSLLQMHIHHNVPSRLTLEELDHPNVWTIVLRHAEAKYGKGSEPAAALAAYTLRKPLEEFTQWVRVEEDRQNRM